MHVCDVLNLGNMFSVCKSSLCECVTMLEEKYIHSLEY